MESSFGGRDVRVASRLSRIVLAILAVAGVAYVAGGREVDLSAPNARILALLVVSGISLAPLVLASWRIGLALAIVYVAVSGFVNHITNYHPLARSLSFVLIVGVLIQWFFEEIFSRWYRHEKIDYPLFRPIAFFAAISVAQMANPLWSDLASGVRCGLSGLSMHVLPMGLVFLGYDLFRRAGEIRSVLLVGVGLMTVMAVFGLVQYAIGLETVAGWGPSFQEVLDREKTWGASLASVMRPISFAKDAGAASSYYLLGVLLALLLLARPDSRAGTSLVVLVAIFLMGMSLFQTYVRSNLILATLAPLAFLVFANRVRAILALATLALSFATAYLLAGPIEREVIVSRISPLSDPVGATVQERGLQVRMIPVMAWQYPLGAGIGRAGPGAYVGATDEDIIRGISPGEGYYANVVYETGIAGLALLVAIFVMAVRRGIDVFARELSDPRLKMLALGSLVLVAVTLAMGLGGPVLYSAPANLFFWFAIGVLYKLPRLQGDPGTGP